MGHDYIPTYYSSLQDTVTTLCKSVLLPFSRKSHRQLPDRSLAKRHSDNLKWQQESFHTILHLIGLHDAGMIPSPDVAAFRSHLLDTLIASPAHHEPPGIIRDKLLFLRELLSSKCISLEEYHTSKRPLLQRLAVQGAEIDCRDFIVGMAAPPPTEEEWSVIDLCDKENIVENEVTKRSSAGIKSLIGKPWRGKGKKKDNVLPDNSPLEPVKSEKAKRRPFRALLFNNKEQRDDQNDKKEAVPLASKKQWGLDEFRKWKKGVSEDESKASYLPLGESLDDVSSSFPQALVASPVGEGPDTKRIKNKIHSDGSSSDFFIDKVLADNIKKELSKIQSELSLTNPNLSFSDDQIEIISTRLPVDKADLKNYFPKSWCDQYGDIVLDVVRKEFKGHVGEMETLRNAAREKHGDSRRLASGKGNDENAHPNLFFNVSRGK